MQDITGKFETKYSDSKIKNKHYLCKNSFKNANFFKSFLNAIFLLSRLFYSDSFLHNGTFSYYKNQTIQCLQLIHFLHTTQNKTISITIMLS